MIKISLAYFADQLNEMVPLVMRELARRQISELYKDKITLPQFLLLKFLHQEGESRMTDLARFMNVSTAAMTGIVERLVRDTYVERTYAKEDRRIIKVKLTPRGNGLVKRINEQCRQMIMETFGRISYTDRQEYLRIFRQIKDILLKEKEPIEGHLR